MTTDPSTRDGKRDTARRRCVDGGRLPCREFTPAADAADAVFVDGEPREIEGATVRNWAHDDVHHFADPGAGEGACRDPGTISEIVLHETAAPVEQDFTSALAEDGLGVHLSVERDGTVVAHNDAVDLLYHAGPHNDASIGVEIVNPVWEPLVRDDDLDTLPVDWPGREGTQPQGDYVLPSLAQCEAATAIIEALTTPPDQGGASGTDALAIPREWIGLTDDGRFRMGGPQQTPNDELVPGIWAHGHFGGEGVHVDGYFAALYSLLRLAGREAGERLDAADAYDAATMVARSDTSPAMAWENGVPYAHVEQFFDGD